jgi:hypothetical protein
MRGRNPPIRVVWNVTVVVAAVTASAAARTEEASAAPARVTDVSDRARQIIFAVRQPGKDSHWYANFGYYAEDTERRTYEDGGRLSRLDLESGQLTVLLDDPRGGVRDPQVHYDGEKILFSYRKGGTDQYHLYEIDADGSGLRQITDGPYDDIEPTYLPDGGIVFCSSRAKRWVNCWLTKVANLHRVNPDGGDLRTITSNNEHDNTPAVLPDGRLLHTRWEYVDRSQVHYHHLWTVNPDGTNPMVYYGNQRPGITMIDAKPIPGSRRIVAIFSPGHGAREHAGEVTLVDPAAGPDDPSSTRRLHPGEDFRDPFPLSAGEFLVARGGELALLDESGTLATLYRLPEADRRAGLECHEPVPLRPRSRERALPSRVDLAATTGSLILADVYDGRNMAGVERGEIKKLLVLESLPKPINFTGGMEPLSYGGTFTLERIVGTVPVEPDGSAYFEIPALRSVFFVALDKDDVSVKRMQSFVNVQPGEVTSCVGCHEQRSKTPLPAKRLAALERPAREITPIAGVPDVLDFPRDLQPILDRHCTSCHGYEATPAGGPRAGGVILTGDRGPLYSHSYFMLTARRQVSDGRNLPRSNYPPRGIGSSASPLMEKISPAHYDVALTDDERRVVRLWIDSAAPYPGTYAALGTGMIGGYAENRIDRSDTAVPSMQVAMKVVKDRCGGCHTGPLCLPESPSDNMGMPPWEIRYGDPRLRFSRHILYNLSRPEQSLLLLAPLAAKAGGHGVCSDPVFEHTTDPDYQRLLTAVRDVKARLDRIKRFDMPGFRPAPAYIREMQDYGVLPRDLGPDDPIDPYATDRAYWRSLWHRPGAATASTGLPGAP